MQRKIIFLTILTVLIIAGSIMAYGTIEKEPILNNEANEITGNVVNDVVKTCGGNCDGNCDGSCDGECGSPTCDCQKANKIESSCSGSCPNAESCGIKAGSCGNPSCNGGCSR